MPAHNSGAAPDKVQFVRNSKHKHLVHHNAIGIAAIRDAAKVFVFPVIGERGEAIAILFFTGPATGARAAGIHHTADGRDVAFFELLHCTARFHHPTDNLVARDARIDGGHGILPLVTRLVQIGMTHPAVQNLDLHVLRPRHATPNCERRHPGSGALSRIGSRYVCVSHL